MAFSLPQQQPQQQNAEAASTRNTVDIDSAAEAAAAANLHGQSASSCLLTSNVIRPRPRRPYEQSGEFQSHGYALARFPRLLHSGDQQQQPPQPPQQQHETFHGKQLFVSPHLPLLAPSSSRESLTSYNSQQQYYQCSATSPAIDFGGIRPAPSPFSVAATGVSTSQALPQEPQNRRFSLDTRRRLSSSSSGFSGEMQVDDDALRQCRQLPLHPSPPSTIEPLQRGNDDMELVPSTPPGQGRMRSNALQPPTQDNSAQRSFRTIQGPPLLSAALPHQVEGSVDVCSRPAPLSVSTANRERVALGHGGHSTRTPVMASPSAASPSVSAGMQKRGNGGGIMGFEDRKRRRAPKRCKAPKGVDSKGVALFCGGTHCMGMWNRQNCSNNDASSWVTDREFRRGSLRNQTAVRDVAEVPKDPASLTAVLCKTPKGVDPVSGQRLFCGMLGCPGSWRRSRCNNYDPSQWMTEQQIRSKINERRRSRKHRQYLMRLHSGIRLA